MHPTQDSPFAGAKPELVKSEKPKVEYAPVVKRSYAERAPEAAREVAEDAMRDLGIALDGALRRSTRLVASGRRV